MEFCTAVRGMGYEGAIKKLWQELDEDQTGWVSLDEIAPQAAEELGEFKEMLETKFGTIERAWNEGLDIDRSGGLTTEEFGDVCKGLGYHGNARRLFQYLDLDVHGTGRITKDELEWLGLPHDPNIVNRRLELEKERLAAKAKTLGAKSLDGFKKLLRRRYGNVVRGWRLGRDLALPLCCGP